MGRVIFWGFGKQTTIREGARAPDRIANGNPNRKINRGKQQTGSERGNVGAGFCLETNAHWDVATLE
jgi:hypothetical protein